MIVFVIIPDMTQEKSGVFQDGNIVIFSSLSHGIFTIYFFKKVFTLFYIKLKINTIFALRKNKIYAK